MVVLIHGHPVVDLFKIMEMLPQNVINRRRITWFQMQIIYVLILVLINLLCK